MTDLKLLLEHWKADPGGTYQSWFLWKDRLRNFGAIRRGLGEVVRKIEEDAFGSLYRGSSLETVVKCVAEQKRIFKGADHAFLWKPKLLSRISMSRELINRPLGDSWEPAAAVLPITKCFRRYTGWISSKLKA